MLTKTNICSVQIYLRGNTDRQQFENDEQNVDVPPLEKFLPTPMNDSTFSLFVTVVLSNNKYYMQITMSVADYYKRQLKTIRFPI